MLITLRSNHGMRLVMYCAVNHGRVAPVSEIARACNMSEAHLAKIAHHLAGCGFLETVRGRCGGVRLAKPPAELSVGAIVRATEIGRCLVECFEPASNTCPLINVCRFRDILGRAMDAFLGVLDGYTIEDLVRDEGDIRVALGLDQLAG